MEVDNDSSILIDSMKKRGIKAQTVCWDDPSVDWTEPDLCIVKSTSNYILNPQAFVNWAKKVEKTTSLWNTSKHIEWNSNKWYLRDLKEKNTPIPQSIFVSKKSHESPKEILANSPWEDIVIKPTIACGSFGLKRFKTESTEAEQYLGELLSEGYVQDFLGDTYNMGSCDAIIQQFIPEIANGEVSMFYFGGEHSHSVIKKAPRGDFRSHPLWGASVEPITPPKDMRSVCEQMLSVIEATEYARIDLVDTVDGPLLIELELIEPFMFFDMFPDKAEVFVDHIEKYLRNNQ